MEVAGGAGYPAVGADLHIPEQRLAERNGRVLVPDVVGQVRRFGNRDLVQG
jgi:hypothetical protein